ncbi:MAG: transcriptional regulator [Spirochaetes bacterium GWC2_52_13]|nr:MAG: transcriptional regulator [Spirochaetes bacterium GWC2_52_13]
MKETTNFGEYLKHKREEKQISLRELARRLELSAPFLSDVENNRRAPLTEERLADLANVLNLNEKEKAEMYDIVGKQKGLLAPDLNPYVTDRPYVNAALRTARNLEANEEDWQWFSDYLINKYSKGKEKCSSSLDALR